MFGEPFGPLSSCRPLLIRRKDDKSKLYLIPKTAEHSSRNVNRSRLVGASFRLISKRQARTRSKMSAVKLPLSVTSEDTVL